MQDLVYSELMGSVTFEMLEDKLVLNIWDNAMFIVTTEENARNYDLEFHPVTAEGIDAYNIVYKEGRVYQADE
jgi:hypothetical protein